MAPTGASTGRAISIAELADGLPLEVRPDGAPMSPLVVVDLDGTASPATRARAAEVADSAQVVLLGRATQPPDAGLASRLTLTVLPADAPVWAVAADVDDEVVLEN